MPWNVQPDTAYTGKQAAWRLKQVTFQGLTQAKKHAQQLRKTVQVATAQGIEQDLADELGTAQIAELQTLYGNLKSFIEACGDTCPDLPAIPSTTNP